MNWLFPCLWLWSALSNLAPMVGIGWREDCIANSATSNYAMDFPCSPREWAHFLDEREKHCQHAFDWHCDNPKWDYDADVYNRPPIM